MRGTYVSGNWLWILSHSGYGVGKDSGRARRRKNDHKNCERVDEKKNFAAYLWQKFAIRGIFYFSFFLFAEALTRGRLNLTEYKRKLHPHRVSTKFTHLPNSLFFYSHLLGRCILRMHHTPIFRSFQNIFLCKFVSVWMRDEILQ